MEAFFICAGATGIAEIGDKTQVLTVTLAARFKRPWPVIFGIFVATLTSRVLAGLLGASLRHALAPGFLRWFLGILFFGAGAWVLKPDRVRDEPSSRGRYGVFTTALITFFIAEIGDKTQLATVILAAKFPSLIEVVAGSTVGIMLADIPVVFLGSSTSKWLPLKAVRIAAAVVFLVLGIATLTGAVTTE
jgi:putative Ca2+/H+ antiporter (TMEM165/GDT1 family)